MRAEQTVGYSAPRITDQRDLQASMMPGLGSPFSKDSDAEVKHGVQPVRDYEAPQITNERRLDAQLGAASEVSDATTKHSAAPVGAGSYEAPQITDQRNLDGRLFIGSANGA